MRVQVANQDPLPRSTLVVGACPAPPVTMLIDTGTFLEPLKPDRQVPDQQLPVFQIGSGDGVFWPLGLHSIWWTCQEAPPLSGWLQSFGFSEGSVGPGLVWGGLGEHRGSCRGVISPQGQRTPLVIMGKIAQGQLRVPPPWPLTSFNPSPQSFQETLTSGRVGHRPHLSPPLLSFPLFLSLFLSLSLSSYHELPLQLVSLSWCWGRGSGTSLLLYKRAAL